MADMVEAALVQEVVSRGVSLLLGDREEEKPSKVHDIEKLEMLRSQLEFALEISKNLPILSLPLLCQRQMLKRRYEECGDLLHERKRRAVEDEEAEKAVTRSSFPRRIVHAVRSSVSSFLSMNRDELSRSGLGRFEWYADKASEFIRDIQSSCSLARYRFFSPLIRPLLEGKTLDYQMEQGSRSHRLTIWSAPTEEHGVVANLVYCGYDRKIPTKCFAIWLVLRLSESTDIVGIATKCLESLGPQYKSFTQVAMGELSQLPTQDFVHCPDPDLMGNFMRFTHSLVRLLRPNPLCCRANGHMPCANNIIPSELSNRFSEEVIYMYFDCSIPAFEYNLQSSAERNVVNDWPPLKLSARFFPHYNYYNLWYREIYALERFGEQVGRINGTSLQQMEEMVLTNAISCFIRQPELTDYEMDWKSPHCLAWFTVGKPKEKVRPQPRAGPKTRRAAKEKALIRS